MERQQIGLFTAFVLLQGPSVSEEDRGAERTVAPLELSLRRQRHTPCFTAVYIHLFIESKSCTHIGLKKLFREVKVCSVATFPHPFDGCCDCWRLCLNFRRKRIVGLILKEKKKSRAFKMSQEKTTERASDTREFFYGTEESVSQGDILDASLNLTLTVFHLLSRLRTNMHVALSTESKSAPQQTRVCMLHDLT